MSPLTLSRYRVPCGRPTSHGHACFEDGLCDACARVRELEGRLHRARKLLERLQWDTESVCCICDEMWVSESEPVGVHKPDCELAALLRELA